jgi:membrane protein implicated in regulation of membrane protease activity
VDHPQHPRSPAARLAAEPGRFDFFQAIRLLERLAGETGTALDDMGAGANGHVELRGTTWSARNTGSTPLPRGHRCVVVRADRLTLLVKAEEAA